MYLFKLLPPPPTPVAPWIPIAPIAPAVPATPVAPWIPIAPIAPAVPATNVDLCHYLFKTDNLGGAILAIFEILVFSMIFDTM